VTGNEVFGRTVSTRHGTHLPAPLPFCPTAMHGNMMAFSIKYEEVAYGARLTLTPKNPAQLDAFRTTVRQHAEQMKKGECSMMRGMMQGMMDGMKNPEPKAKPEEEDHSAHHPPGEKK